jgi:hypothetical protein
LQRQSTQTTRKIDHNITRGNREKQCGRQFATLYGRFYNLPRFTFDLYNLPHITLPFIICHILHWFLYNLPYLSFYRSIHYL